MKIFKYGKNIEMIEKKFDKCQKFKIILENFGKF